MQVPPLNGPKALDGNERALKESTERHIGYLFRYFDVLDRPTFFRRMIDPGRRMYERLSASDRDLLGLRTVDDLESRMWAYYNKGWIVSALRFMALLAHKTTIGEGWVFVPDPVRLGTEAVRVTEGALHDAPHGKRTLQRAVPVRDLRRTTSGVPARRKTEEPPAKRERSGSTEILAPDSEDYESPEI